MSAQAPTGVLGRLRGATRSDETLLDRAHKGDAASFEAIYRRHHDAVLGYCLLRLGDRQTAEDATQEVFLKAAAMPAGTIANVKAWLFTIARNVVIDTTRRRAARPDEVDLDAALGTDTPVAEDTAFAAMDVTANVFIALRRLSSRHRNAIVLREFHDRSSKEIADELDMRPSAVDVLLCRARAAFGRAYAEVAEMPLACRKTTELIYRETGSGLSDSQRERMDAHLAACPRCRAEHRRAHSPRFVGALLPWMAYANRFLLPSWPVPAKAALGAVIGVAVVTSGFVGHVAQTTPKFDSALAAAPRQSLTPTSVLELQAAAGDAAASVGANDGLAHESGRLTLEAHPKARAEETHHSSGIETHRSESHQSQTTSERTGSSHDGDTDSPATPTGEHTTEGDTHTGTEETHE